MARSISDRIREKQQKRAEIDVEIDKLKQEAGKRLGLLADKLDLFDTPVSDEDIEAGFRHAMQLAQARTVEQT